MKNILTLTLIFCSLLSYAQPTLATLDARLKTVETLTKVIETSTMTLPQFIRAVDSLALVRVKLQQPEMQGWVNAKKFHTKDSVTAIIATLQLPQMQAAIVALQNKPDNSATLQAQIDALVAKLYPPIVLPK